MWRRRILYGLALAAALLLQIFYDRYLARFVLAGVVCAPILSLLLTLPAALCLRPVLTADGPEAPRGGESRWRLRLERPALLPVARLRLRLRFADELTGWTGEERVTCSGPEEREWSFPVETGHCGRVTCRAVRVRLTDCLGLFSIPLRRPAPAAVLVLPRPAPPEELPLPEPPDTAAGKTGTSGGDYELRDYRPGDPVRSIHWKLSSKRDELVVREWLGESRPQIVLDVDRFGEPERLDRVLDRLYGLSLELLARDWPHLVRWEEAGSVRAAAVSDRASLLACLDGLLSSPAPLRGTPMAELTPPEGGLPRISVTAGEEAEP